MRLRTILVVEHMHIMKVMAAIEREISSIRQTNKADVGFIDTIVDFIRTYADKTHHGKEEDILFRVLASKEMSDEDKAMMQGLLDEHVFARKTVAELVEAKEQYSQGRQDAADMIVEKLDILVRLYPKHIQKEDDIFFPVSDTYLSEEEQSAMLEEGRAFDSRMPIDKYVQIASELVNR